MKRAAFALLLSFTLSGCAFFAGKPPLPKRASSIERLPPPAPSTDFAALIAEADVIYFPVERVGHGGKSEPAARLIEALQQRGSLVALGWGVIDATEQSALDSLAEKERKEREQAVELLPVVGSGRAREHCRSVLRALDSANVTHLALRYASGSGAEARDFAAERIAQFLRTAGADAKALIFLREDDLDSEQGVPAFVAQKIPARQLVLGPERARPRLLTRVAGRSGAGFEIVDRAPRPARD